MNCRDSPWSAYANSYGHLRVILCGVPIYSRRCLPDPFKEKSMADNTNNEFNLTYAYLRLKNIPERQSR